MAKTQVKKVQRTLDDSHVLFFTESFLSVLKQTVYEVQLRIHGEAHNLTMEIQDNGNGQWEAILLEFGDFEKHLATAKTPALAFKKAFKRAFGKILKRKIPNLPKVFQKGEYYSEPSFAPWYGQRVIRVLKGKRTHTIDLDRESITWEGENSNGHEKEFVNHLEARAVFHATFGKKLPIYPGPDKVMAKYLKSK